MKTDALVLKAVEMRLFDKKEIRFDIKRNEGFATRKLRITGRIKDVRLHFIM